MESIEDFFTDVGRGTFNYGTLGGLSREMIPQLMEPLNADAGSVLVGDNGVLTVHTSFGLKKNRSQEAKIPIGVGVTGKAARKRENVWIPDTNDVDNYIEGIPDSKWEYAIPLYSDQKQISLVIDFESSSDQRPSKSIRNELTQNLIF